jgi:hypothetical protein
VEKRLTGASGKEKFLKERLLPDIVGLKLATEDTEVTEFFYIATKMHKKLKNCKNKNQLTFCVFCAFSRPFLYYTPPGRQVKSSPAGKNHLLTLACEYGIIILASVKEPCAIIYVYIYGVDP